MTIRLPVTTLLLTLAISALPCIGTAQENSTPASTTTPMPISRVAPLYSSGEDIGAVRNSAFNTPESDGRPGLYFFDLGAEAVKHKNYSHAIAMYKVSASWAYKPAEYNLGVMYLRGQGAAVDLPRALAWMTLAAERNNPQYAKTRDLINMHLTDAQFQQANVIFGQLLPMFGDKVALNRAKVRWHEVLAAATGSRVGSSASPLQVGAVAGAPNRMLAPYSGGTRHVGSAASDIVGAHKTDGAVAFQQLRASNNPYDPKFEWQPDAIGEVTVGALKPVKKTDVKNAAASGDSSSTPSSNR